MKNVKILNSPIKVVFDLVGSLEEIKETEVFLKTLPHFFVTTGVVYQLGADNHGIQVTCPQIVYEQVLLLLNDFIFE